MTLAQLEKRLQIKGREWALRWDEESDDLGLVARRIEIRDALYQWGDLTQMWFADNLVFFSNSQLGPYAGEDSRFWSVNSVAVKVAHVSEIFGTVPIEGMKMIEVGMADAARDGTRYVYTSPTRMFYRPGRNKIQFLPALEAGDDNLTFNCTGYVHHADLDALLEDAEGDASAVNIDIPDIYIRDFVDFCLALMLENSPVDNQGAVVAELRGRLFGPNGRNGRLNAILSECNDAPTVKSPIHGEKITRLRRVSF